MRRCRQRLSSLTTVSLLAGALGACVWRGPAEATPQRPTVANSPATTADGTFELEAGVQLDPSDSTAVPLTLKHGLGPRSELFLGWPAFVDLDEPDVDGTGDLLVGMRHRVLEAGDVLPAAAFELAAEVPTASNDPLGNDEVDFLPSLSVARSVGPLDLTAYYQLGVLGAPGEGTDLQHVVAADAGVPLGDEWGVFAEVASILQPERELEQVLAVGGASWAVMPSLVLDAAVFVGLTDDAPSFALAFGFTHNFGGLDR